MDLLSSLNHFGRFREHFGGDRYTDLLGGLEVERQIEFGGLHERKFPGFFALKDLIDVFGGAPREIRQINAVTRKPARFDKIGAIVNCRKTIFERGLGDLRNMRIEQRVGENKERARAGFCRVGDGAVQLICALSRCRMNAQA
jgi:hypothetical protein